MTDKTNILSSSDLSKEVVFPNGIPGFENLSRYRVSYSDTESGRVYWMESCDESDICFTLVDPKFYALNYSLELTDDEEALLQVSAPEDVVVLLMLRKEESSDASVKPGLHANIAAPILINVETRLGLQKVIPTPRVAMNISN